MNMREFYEYALSFYAIPYEWGGSGVNHRGGYGFDCSGYVLVLLSRGGIKFNKDLTANDLCTYFKQPQNSLPRIETGSLAFFGTEQLASHVGWMIDDKCMISAAGGGSYCKTPIIAKRNNAYIKIQPVSCYKIPAFIGAWMPKYSEVFV